MQNSVNGKALADSDAGIVRERLTVFVSDEVTQRLVRQGIESMGLGDCSVHAGTIDAAIELLETARSPRALLVDISGIEQPAARVHRLAEVCEPGVAVVAMGERNDVGLFRDLLLAGVGDYLVKPLSPPAIEGALTRLLGLKLVDFAAPEKKLGEVVTVVGTRGGVGATTIATHLAWALANRKQPRRVALVDLNLRYGACGLMLGLKSNGGLLEALERPQRVDRLFLDRAMIQCGARLSLLAGSVSDVRAGHGSISGKAAAGSVRATTAGALPVEDAFAVAEHALGHLLAILRENYHYIFIDLPRTDGALLSEAIALAQTRIFVLDQTTLAIRDMLALKPLIDASSGSQHRVVLNRAGELGRYGIANGDVETAIGLKIDAVIPFDAGNVAGAANAGLPLLAKPGEAARAISSLADRLAGDVTVAGRGWLGFGSRRRRL